MTLGDMNSEYFVGKTIASVEEKNPHLWRIEFTDGTAICIAALGSPLKCAHMVGEYIANYDLPTDAELAEDPPGLKELLAKSRVVEVRGESF